MHQALSRLAGRVMNPDPNDQTNLLIIAIGLTLMAYGIRMMS